MNGYKTQADLFIKIETINRFTPEFTSDFYVYYIDENSAFNTTVGLLTAYDNDTLGDYGQLHYELNSAQNHLFAIEAKTGRIFTTSTRPKFELDRESLDTFHMSVDAIDGGGLRKSVQVVIKLRDLNDNAPRFISNSWVKNNAAANNFSLSKWME